MSEINFDGLIGPTHNYSGLSEGNNASKKTFLHPQTPKMQRYKELKKQKL